MVYYQDCKNPPLFDRGLTFVIKNQTTDTITWYIPPANRALSTENLPIERPTLHRTTPPGKKHGEFLQTTKNDNYFDDLPTDTLHIFILNYTIYRTQSWDSIVTNNIIVERIKITEDSLKAIDYNIVVE